MNDIAASEGPEVLHSMLQKVDPESASKFIVII